MPIPEPSPLTKHIRAIQTAPEYLTPQAATALFEAIAPLLPEESRDPRDDSLRGQISSLLSIQEAILERIQNAPDNIPISDLQVAVKTGKDLCLLLMKLNTFLQQEKRETAIEAAVLRALNDTDDPEITKLFLDALKDRLEEQQEDREAA